MKPLSRLSVLVCLLLPTAMFAQSVPVSRTEILGRLVYRASPSFIAHLIKQRGINFTPNDSFLTQVKLAGGEGILLDRLSSGDFTVNRGPGNVDETPVEHLAKCAELVHTGAPEPAEEECRAAIKENPKTPWPLLITAELLMRNQDRGAPSDSSDLSGEVARAKEYDDLTNRAAALDPQGLASDQVEWVSIGPQMFLIRNSPTTAPQAPLGRAFSEAVTDPELGSGHRILALRSFAAQDWENAQRELQEAIRLEPDYVLNHDCLANFYLSGKNENAAIAELRETVRIAPFDTDLRRTLSTTFESLGRTPEAIEELKNLLIISPRNVEASNALVDLYLEHKELKAAITELQRLLKASSLVITDEAKFIEIRYWEIDRLAGLLKRNRELDAAAEQYLFLLRDRPEDAALHNDYGNVLMDQNRLDEAIDEYNLALRFDPGMSSAHHNIGMCQARKNRLDSAIDEFRKALELNPEEERTPVYLGVALGQKGDLNAAKEQFQQYVEKHPNDPSAHATLGFAFYQLKDTPEAIKELLLALELKPDSPEVENNLAWIYATTEEQKLRNPAEALVLARKAVKGSTPPNPAYLDTLAEALLLNGQPVEALKTEQQAAALDPKNPEMQTRLAHFQAACTPTSAAKH